jgi:hypothetical protein
MTRRRRSRAKWRRRLARRLGIVPVPLRSLPAIEQQYHMLCRVKSTRARGEGPLIHAPWPGRFRED